MPLPKRSRQPLHIATVILVAALGALATGASAHAAPGDLDLSFGAGSGRVTLNFTASPFGGYADDAHAVAVQPDGKIVLGGSSLVPSSSFDFALARLLPDGTPDPSFGGGDGRVTTDVGGASEANYVTDIALQPDGKIVAVGYDGVVVTRYTATGEPDAGFGTNGVTITPLPGSYAWGVALQPDAKIVVTGQYWNGLGNALFIARYTTSGALDPTFGTGGVVTASGAHGVASSIAVQPDGKIVVGGGGIGRFMATRYTTTGSLDESFGADGVAELTSGAQYYSLEGRALTIAPDGRIIVAGRVTQHCCSGGEFGVAVLTADGAFDPSFGEDGVATVGFDGYASFGDSASSVVVQANGTIVLGGRSMQLAPGPVTEFALARFRPDGSLDEDFGDEGRVLTPFYYWPGFPSLSSSEITDLALAADGAIVAAGLTFTGAGSQDFGVARYLGDPIDTTPPTLGTPDSVAVDATSPSGASVEYEISVEDDHDPSPSSACAPPSGEQFPIGDTTVECSATDAAGNSATAEFTVHVRGASEQLSNLLELVATYELETLGRSLEAKLAAADAHLGAGRPAQAEVALTAFVVEVQAQRGKELTPDQADALEAAALRIVDVIAS